MPETVQKQTGRFLPFQFTYWQGVSCISSWYFHASYVFHKKNWLNFSSYKAHTVLYMQDNRLPCKDSFGVFHPNKFLHPNKRCKVLQQNSATNLSLLKARALKLQHQDTLLPHADTSQCHHSDSRPLLFSAYLQPQKVVCPSLSETNASFLPLKAIRGRCPSQTVRSRLSFMTSHHQKAAWKRYKSTAALFQIIISF